MRALTVVSRTSMLTAAALVAAVSVALAKGTPHKEAPRSAPPPDVHALRDVGRDFEAARLLTGADRLPALETVGQSLERAMKGDLDADQRLAARCLGAEITREEGDARAASELWARAAEGSDKSRFADHIGFAAIQAMEGAGRDVDAAKEWARWEKRFPTSPLMSEARLAEARNALRRGEVKEGNRLLTGMLAMAPWMERDPRVQLTRGLALLLDKKPADALVALGPAPQGPTATYLKAYCMALQGDRLRSAALFQETAERWPDSPLRDPALIAKAGAFLAARDYKSASEEFARAAQKIQNGPLKAEAELRAAGALFLSGRTDSALANLRYVVASHPNTDVAARAQFLTGEALVAEGKDAEAIVAYNRVLTSYFQHEVAASAQYRVARCLDRMGRHTDATGAYQAVVSGYPLQPEAPAAAYLAGVGLMMVNKPLAAAPYFQLVLDRYAHTDAQNQIVFARPEHQELVEAALCQLELCYHRAGNLGQLSGAPHLMLDRLPPSHSTWRAWALLIDADAMAAQARYADAQARLEKLTRDYPDHPVAASAVKLLAWTYARQGNDSLAIATEERLLARYGASGGPAIVAAATLDIAHERFNQKRYREAAVAYEDFLRRFPNHPKRLIALYQAGMSYLRINRAGDAVDRWEAIVRDSADAPLAERAFARMGDLYFQAEHYADAKRCYEGLLQHFADSPAAGLASLRLAQCEYNAGHDAAALAGFSTTIARYPNTGVAREAQRGTELALYRLSQSPNGKQELAKLVDQFPGSAFAADAMFQIARKEYQEKHWDTAADGFRRVVSQFPGYSSADQAQFLLADALVQSHNTDEARAAYEQFLSFFPSSDLAPTVQFRLGLMQFEGKDYLRAALAFTRVLDDSAAPDVRSASRYNLALCRRMLGDTDSARVELERHAKEFPNDARAADVAYQLADLDEAAGNTAAALAGFEKARAMKPRAALAVELDYRIGRAREGQGETEKALAAYQRAAASPERDAPYRLSAVARVAAIYEKKKDYPKALAAYRDLAHNSKDHELAAAAAARANQLLSATPR